MNYDSMEGGLEADIEQKQKITALNAFRQTGRQIVRQIDRQRYKLIDRQTNRQSQTMINQERKGKTLTDKTKSHKKRKIHEFRQTDRQIDRQTDRNTGRIVLFLKDKLPQWEFTLEAYQPNARSWAEKYPNLPKIICDLGRMAIIQTFQATE